MPRPSKLHVKLRREPSKEYRRASRVLGKLKKGRKILTRSYTFAFPDDFITRVYGEGSIWGKVLDEFDREMLATERIRISEKGGAAL